MRNVVLKLKAERVHLCYETALRAKMIRADPSPGRGAKEAPHQVPPGGPESVSSVGVVNLVPPVGVVNLTPPVGW